jgi:hypothetical protein
MTGYLAPGFGSLSPYRYVLRNPKLFLVVDARRGLLFDRGRKPSPLSWSSGKLRAFELLCEAHAMFWTREYRFRETYLSASYYIALLNIPDIMLALLAKDATVETDIEWTRVDGAAAVAEKRITISYAGRTCYITAFVVRDTAHTVNGIAYATRVIEPAAGATISI